MQKHILYLLYVNIAPSEPIMQREIPVGKGAHIFLPMKKVSKKETSALRSELEKYQKQGVKLWLDGQPGTPKSIAKAHLIAEEGTYMRDYVRDDTGEVANLYFNLVRDE